MGGWEWEGKCVCVTSMGGTGKTGDSDLDGCSGRASILFRTSRAAVTNPAPKGT